MFETHESGKRKTFFSLPNQYHWDYVGIALNRYWLFVSYSIVGDEGYSITQNVMLCEVQQLVEMTRQDVAILFVGLVSPGYMNESGRWKMDSLKEIWLRVNSQYSDQYENVFVLEDGKILIDMAVPPKNKTLVEEKIFSL